MPGWDIARHGHAEILAFGDELAACSILIEMMGLPASREIAGQLSVGRSRSVQLASTSTPRVLFHLFVAQQVLQDCP